MMEDITDNWVVKENLKSIEILNFDVIERLVKLGIPYKGFETFINWDCVKPKYDFFYDFQGNEIEIKERLKRSELVNIDFLLIDIGFKKQVIRTKTNFFIEYWEDFVASNGFCGIFIFSEKGEFYMEFTDDASYKLYSNFLI